tara:strand:- start:185 stop:655 length:471 start_codon:yes stop_codon:yes gene_type:complete
MAELLTDEIIIEHLENDGFMEEPDAPWILEYIESEYGGKLDNENSWAKGHEDRLIYYQSTADCYDVYISTESHDHKNLYFEQEVYYYMDADQFSDDILNSITCGGSAWVDPSIWSELEYEFNYMLEEWWRDIYDELYEQKKEELLDSEEYYLENED